MPVAIRQVLVGNLRCAGDSTGNPDSGLDSQLGSKSILDALDQVAVLQFQVPTGTRLGNPRFESSRDSAYPRTAVQFCAGAPI